MFEPIVQQLQPFSREFSQRGKQLYLVGGAVRNLLLDRPVHDFDFATDARPDEVQGFFKKVLPTGLQHGTVTVLFQGDSYEVTTFRVDGVYSDGRRPDGVEFTPSLEEDLKRRDFTINAMALDLADGTLIDPHDGRGDLAKGLLRAIGDPGRRFDEDALRLLRLFRFASQLGFSIAPDTWAAVSSRRERLALVSRERLRDELIKAMAGSHPEKAWGPLTDLGFLDDLLAPLKPRALGELEFSLLRTLPPVLRWSFWLTLSCGSDRQNWELSLKSLAFSNKDLLTALGPPQALDFFDADEPLSVTAKAIVEAWGDRKRIQPGTEYLGALVLAGYWKDTRGLIDELVRIANSQEPIFLAEMALGGRELLASGWKPGPQIGTTLRALQKAIWKDPNLNTVEGLMRRIQDSP